MVKGRTMLTRIIGMVSVICLGCAPPAAFGGGPDLPVLAGPQVVMLAAARHVSLKISLPNGRFISGDSIPVSALFRNHGRRPLILPLAAPPPSVFNKIMVRWADGKPAPRTADSPRPGRLYSAGIVAMPVAPGHSCRWGRVPINSYADVSMPGKYFCTLVAGRIKSNRLGFQVVTPVLRVANGVTPLVIAGAGPAVWSAVNKNMQIAVRQQVTAQGKRLRSVQVFFRNAAGTPIRVRLCGNVLADFGSLQVRGPDGVNGDELIKKPQPHWIPIPNRMMTALTAYGKWLAEHPPKKTKWHSYALKPGVIYEYTIPVNIGCRYDLSRWGMAGVYHVRLRLGRKGAWSRWTKFVISPD